MRAIMHHGTLKMRAIIYYMDLWQSLQIILWFGHVVCFPPIWSRSKKQTTTKRTQMKNVDNVEKKWSHICMCKFVSGTWCALFMLWDRNVIYINLWLKCRKCFNQTFINYKICMCRWIDMCRRFLVFAAWQYEKFRHFA